MDRYSFGMGISWNDLNDKTTFLSYVFYKYFLLFTIEKNVGEKTKKCIFSWLFNKTLAHSKNIVKIKTSKTYFLRCN